MNVVPLHAAPIRSRSIAYGRHGLIQVFAGCEAAWAECRETAERIMSFEPRTSFFVIDDGDRVVMVRASGETEDDRRPAGGCQLELCAAPEPRHSVQLRLF